MLSKEMPFPVNWSKRTELSSEYSEIFKSPFAPFQFDAWASGAQLPFAHLTTERGASDKWEQLWVQRCWLSPTPGGAQGPGQTI